MSDKYDANLYTREDLLKIGIYDLRELGREVGVPSPTTLKKEELIDYIVGILYGQIPKNSSKTLRGRPARAREKSYQKFIDLIDKVEAPKCNNNFISKEDDHFDTSFAYSGTVLSKVASYKEDYVNAVKDDVLLKKGVVCFEDNNFYVRKLRFVATKTDAVIPTQLVNEYNIKDNDIIDYFLDEDEQKVSQIIKINGNMANKLDILSTKNVLSAPEDSISIQNQFSIKTPSSDIVIASSADKRIELVQNISQIFREYEYSVCKVCFDRPTPAVGVQNTLQMTEYFPECVGDEFETVSMIESAVERAKFFARLGYKTLLIIDNLNWLISILNTYPAASYGNFVQKMAKLSVSDAITVVCVTGPMGQEQLNQYVGIFDKIINAD